MTDDLAAGHLIAGDCYFSFGADVGFGSIEIDITSAVQVCCRIRSELGSQSIDRSPVAIGAAGRA